MREAAMRRTHEVKKRRHLVELYLVSPLVLLLFLLPLGVLRAPETKSLAWTRPEQDKHFRRDRAPIITSRVTGEDSPGFQITLYYVDGSPAAIVRRLNTNSDAFLVSHIEAGTCAPLTAMLGEFKELTLPVEIGTGLYFPAQTHQIWVSGLVDEIYIKVTTPSPNAEDYAFWGKQEPLLQELANWNTRLKTTVVRHCLSP